MPTSQAARAEQAVADVLATQGIRFTPARRLIVRSLAAAPGPLAAGDLHRALPSHLPLSSLYRTLTVLTGARVLSREHDAVGVARYELAEWLAGHHHHLVCNSCGEVRDVVVTAETERTISGLVQRIAHGAGYAAAGHRIDIEGTCPACAAR